MLQQARDEAHRFAVTYNRKRRSLRTVTSELLSLPGIGPSKRRALLQAFGKFSWMADHHRYKNNYDYQLSLAILNKRFYMTNGSILLFEDASLFSPISVLHYSFYRSPDQIPLSADSENIQCLLGKDFIPFGNSQQPGLTDYADGANTLLFLRNL